MVRSNKPLAHRPYQIGRLSLRDFWRRVRRNVSPPPSAELMVRFQWFVGGKVLLGGDGVREGDRLSALSSERV